MRIRLKERWGSWPAGRVISVSPERAKALVVDLGIAKELDPFPAELLLAKELRDQALDIKAEAATAKATAAATVKQPSAKGTKKK